MKVDLSIVTALIGLTVSILTVISFVLTRNEKHKNDGVNDGEMHNDIKYIKQTQTDIIVSQKEISNKLDKNNERVTRLEEQVKMHENRINKLEN